MFDLYSRRKKDAEGNSEVFIYDEFQQTFRNQFFKIINDVFDEAINKNHDFRNIVKWLCESYSREKGIKAIYGDYCDANSICALEYYIDNCNNEDFLDLMDFIFGFFISNPKIHEYFYLEDDNFFKSAIDELNLRLKQHSLGYEFINGKIVVKTSTVAHENIIKPALQLLLDEDFRGAEEEYLLAFEHFKKGENKDAILNAIKAFESTMKAICLGLKYTFDKDKDTAKVLIKILENNSFYPSYLNNHITGIRTTLESGAPTLRNKKAGHGQGSTVENVNDEFVEYSLNLVATNIIFLYKLYKEKKLEAAS